MHSASSTMGSGKPSLYLIRLPLPRPNNSGDQLTIDDAGAHWQRDDCRGDRRKAGCEVAPILAEQRNGQPHLVELYPKAVELDFVRPALPGRGRGFQLGNCWGMKWTRDTSTG